MTQNVPPGIDFSNDPAAAGPQLLLSRHPAEAARRPELHPYPDQRAEMPVRTISSRTATWRCATRSGAPTTSRTRSAKARGKIARSAASARSPGWREGPKQRLRAESFADHYSQARQFFNSQTGPEQRHIAMALTFELSKVETPVIRERMVVASAEHRRGVSAPTVADKLGMEKTAEAGRMRPSSPRDDLAAIPGASASSRTVPRASRGRKVGVLVEPGRRCRAAQEAPGRYREGRRDDGSSSPRRSAA